MKNNARLLPLLGLMLAGCAQSADYKEAVASEPAAFETTAPAAPTPAEPAAPEVPLARLWRAAGHPVIYQGSMELEVPDFTAASARLDTVLTQRGAYLTTANETTDTERHQQVLTIRVPSARFLVLTADLARLGIVHRKELTSRDIATELAQHQAAARRPDTTASRAATAEVQLLTEQATLATLHLTYYQPRPLTDTSPAQAISPQVRAGLWFGWRLVGLVLVGLAYLWPLVVALGAWGLYRWRQINRASGTAA
ncbi:DUF4349 domain-containing protein [Hymenobacter metallilatus]|uniref:DUF4349 domain-containing protein n=1 Tax=Hymenobacter metallilatus TaxID=2493666 RepID=A0A3R9MZF5_9BACT|nr:DUF4349 domain-containing protein [Hymenobacter metallilatus]RSK34627.1 DUF4349 domain-containing protein [Hymenobacter metallilatus]